jgi:DNA ligase-1
MDHFVDYFFKKNRWLSEKFDGIRAIWNGEKLYSKNGTRIMIPPFLLKELPLIHLDGELW